MKSASSAYTIMSREDRGERRAGRIGLVKLLRGKQQKERGKVSHLGEYPYCSRTGKTGDCRVEVRALFLVVLTGSVEFRRIEKWLEHGEKFVAVDSVKST
ncbi:hypothetical protein DD238_006244 [Peronospora effusa]|uniref:Uncharacterized protein n=1 Tax=Peronospora effusa TaxID=542832 RepID=A0A3M6VPV6_9STRA|nr:hypothetical protein DD238_006244 [Peronospora effusa]